MRATPSPCYILCFEALRLAHRHAHPHTKPLLHVGGDAGPPPEPLHTVCSCTNYTFTQRYLTLAAIVVRNVSQMLRLQFTAKVLLVWENWAMTIFRPGMHRRNGSQEDRPLHAPTYIANHARSSTRGQFTV